jgi:hypothetical protein
MARSTWETPRWKVYLTVSTQPLDKKSIPILPVGPDEQGIPFSSPIGVAVEKGLNDLLVFGRVQRAGSVHQHPARLKPTGCHLQKLSLQVGQFRDPLWSLPPASVSMAVQGA